MVSRNDICQGWLAEEDIVNFVKFTFEEMSGEPVFVPVAGGSKAMVTGRCGYGQLAGNRDTEPTAIR